MDWFFSTDLKRNLTIGAIAGAALIIPPSIIIIFGKIIMSIIESKDKNNEDAYNTKLIIEFAQDGLVQDPDEIEDFFTELDKIKSNKELENIYNEDIKDSGFYNYEKSIFSYYVLLDIIITPVDSDELNGFYAESEFGEKFNYEAGLFTLLLAAWTGEHIYYISSKNDNKYDDSVITITNIIATCLSYFKMRGGIYNDMYDTYDKIKFNENTTADDVKKISDSVKSEDLKYLLNLIIESKK